MTSDSNEDRSLRQIELEVLEEGREWMRRRLEQKIQQEATRQGGAFPPERQKDSASAKAVDESANRRRAGKARGMAR